MTFGAIVRHFLLYTLYIIVYCIAGFTCASVIGWGPKGRGLLERRGPWGGGEATLVMESNYQGNLRLMAVRERSIAGSRHITLDTGYHNCFNYSRLHNRNGPRFRTSAHKDEAIRISNHVLTTADGKMSRKFG